VIKEGEDLKKCPHLSVAASLMADAVQAQQQAGIGRRRKKRPRHPVAAMQPDA
jgi:hypothetical protein